MAVQTREEIHRMRRLNRANKALRIRTLGIIKDTNIRPYELPGSSPEIRCLARLCAKGTQALSIGWQ